jgi:hypothetical protein
MSRALVLALVLAAAPALAESPTTTTVPAPVPQKTEVKGNVPADLVGRWLVVGVVKLPDGKVRPVARAWEIRQGPEHLELLLSLHALPGPVNQKVAAAGDAGTSWSPDADDLRLVATDWDGAPTLAGELTGVESRITTSEEYPPEFRADAVTRDTKLAIVLQENFTGRSGALRSISIYGVRDETPTTLGGTFVTTTLAAAPIPIPITLNGDFTAYRIGGRATGSWLDRLFAGCHRG